ncbi:MAG: phosphoribosylamine--glycine ligase [Thermoleophilaceae bacterium]
MERILIVGAGGREHAIARALMRGRHDVELLAAPGNAGMARDGVRCLEHGIDEHGALVAAARGERVDLVVVGPEAPLVGGLVDMLGDAGVRAFGPSGAAARIEGSKSYAKELMRAASVPTAAHALTRTRAEAEAALGRYPIVLKADALAQGKGVAVCADEGEAREALDVFFSERRFGDTRVIVEEHLEGEELSLLALCDGMRAVPMAPARDYKRIFDGDRGPNTGGMGSYSPVAEIGPDQLRELSAAVHQPIVDELRGRGTPFHGVLYAGLMMTPSGPRVLEYNCRFGDPEAQAVLPRLRSDLLELLEGSVRAGGLANVEVEWSDDPAVTVVLASAGYPGDASSGDVIDGIAEAAATGAEVLHAGTAERDGKIVTAGGRVLSVTGMGATIGEAREHAYAAVDLIEFNGKQLRRDIAAGAREGVGA